MLNISHHYSKIFIITKMKPVTPLLRFMDVSYSLRWDAATSLPYYLGFLNSRIRSSSCRTGEIC